MSNEKEFVNNNIERMQTLSWSKVVTNNVMHGGKEQTRVEHNRMERKGSEQNRIQ